MDDTNTVADTTTDQGRAAPRIPRGRVYIPGSGTVGGESRPPTDGYQPPIYSNQHRRQHIEKRPFDKK